MPFNEEFAAVLKILELMSLEPRTQVAGITVIVDSANFGFKQFTSVSIDNLRAIMNTIQVRRRKIDGDSPTHPDWTSLALTSQTSFPVWFRAIHLVRTPRFFNIVLGLLKPLMATAGQVRTAD